MGIGAHWDPEGSRETKVCQLQLALAVDQQILRLQVAVQDTVLVAELHAAYELEKKGLEDPEVAAAVAVVEVLLQILVQVLKDQRQLVLRVHYVVQPHDVWVL